MRKKLNEAGMQSELSGSAFFQVPSATDFPASQSPVVSPPSLRPREPSLELSAPDRVASVLPDGDPNGRPYERTPIRRTITRYAFEFFQDQVESLRRFALDEKRRGEKGSMSQMVREAIDLYLARRHRTED